MLLFSHYKYVLLGDLTMSSLPSPHPFLLQTRLHLLRQVRIGVVILGGKCYFISSLVSCLQVTSLCYQPSLQCYYLKLRWHCTAIKQLQPEALTIEIFL